MFPSMLDCHWTLARQTKLVRIARLRGEGDGRTLREGRLSAVGAVDGDGWRRVHHLHRDGRRTGRRWCRGEGGESMPRRW